MIDPSGDPRGFRDALGRFATGVTVVTAASADGPVGITANSFASVSLDPPLVLWCPAKSSARFTDFETAERFAIHVLGGRQQQVADGFTRDKHAFDGLDWAEGSDGVPLIDGCLARFDCALHESVDAGDHLVVLGRVLRAQARDGLPLLFQQGRYVSLKG
ncbi:MAG: flavin reductase family protein [Paracoccaceae bacterium]